MASNEPIHLFPNIDGDHPEVTEIESMCMNCHQNVSLAINSRTFLLMF
jgi:hypothetical protein